jgi:pilus assembly protein CpaE
MAGIPKSRVLIVDAIQATRENLAKLLFFDRNLEVVGLAGTAQEAVTQASKHQPELIVLDLTLPDTDSVATMEALLSHTPEARIIGVSTEGKAHAFTGPLPGALRALLIKPVTSESLRNALRHAGQQ